MSARLDQRQPPPPGVTLQRWCCAGRDVQHGTRSCGSSNADPAGHSEVSGAAKPFKWKSITTVLNDLFERLDKPTRPPKPPCK